MYLGAVIFVKRYVILPHHSSIRTKERNTMAQVPQAANFPVVVVVVVDVWWSLYKMRTPDRISAVPLIAKKAISNVVMWEEESLSDAEPYIAMANPNTWWWVRWWQGEREREKRGRREGELVLKTLIIQQWQICVDRVSKREKNDGSTYHFCQRIVPCVWERVHWSNWIYCLFQWCVHVCVPRCPVGIDDLI